MEQTKEWQQEQQRVTQIVGEIEHRLDGLTDQLGHLRTDIVGIRQTFWDDVTVNLENEDEAIETAASVRQQAEVLSELERHHLRAARQAKALTRLMQTPYFGRIDFVEDSETDVEQVYIGTSSFQDESGLRFLIYDWRAPVSSLYYDYAPGRASYATPGGMIDGEMTLKRQFVIRDGQLRSLFDTGVTIGDELLQEVLGGKQSDTQMRSIVATIQREQNQIIREEQARLLIVQGAAGSGKTSAALQRVAYLLYRYRETIQAEQIVLFSPNPMFNSYVATVLPELGEDNMQQTTYQDYLERRIGSLYQVENAYEQMEYTLAATETQGYAARMEAIRFKATRSFMAIIDAYAAYAGREAMCFADIGFRGRVLLSQNQIAAYYDSLDPVMSIPNRVQLVAEWLLKQLHRIAREERQQPWVDEEIELLDTEAYAAAYAKLLNDNKFTENSFDDFEQERELLAKTVVQEQFKPLRKRVKRLGFVDVRAMYRQLFAQPGLLQRFAAEADLPHAEQWCTQTVQTLDEGRLAYEDATPFLYLLEQIEGFQMNNSIRHVFVDEAQDYSPFQFAMLRRFFPRSKMTVLGDVNQSIYAHGAAEGTFDGAAALFALEETRTFRLYRSYRSTQQIVAFTRDMLLDGQEIELFQRDGNTPTVTIVHDDEERLSRMQQRIAQLQEAGNRTIAIICKTAAQSEDLHARMSERIEMRLIRVETSSFSPGVLVIPSYLAKGVEFDAVLICDASAACYAREEERKLFYTACTRAMHELHLYVQGDVTPFLDRAAASTYELVRSGNPATITEKV